MLQAYDFIGMPVCAVLKDGTYRYGIIRGIQGNQIILQGFKGTKKLSKNRKKAKAQIASFGGLGNMLGMLGGMGGLGRMFGGGAGGPVGPGGGGIGGIAQGFGGWMKIGMGVLSFIIPLMRNFKI